MYPYLVFFGVPKHFAERVHILKCKRYKFNSACIESLLLERGGG